MRSGSSSEIALRVGPSSWEIAALTPELHDIILKALYSLLCRA